MHRHSPLQNVGSSRALSWFCSNPETGLIKMKNFVVSFLQVIAVFELLFSLSHHARREWEQEIKIGYHVTF